MIQLKPISGSTRVKCILPCKLYINEFIAQKNNNSRLGNTFRLYTNNPLKILKNYYPKIHSSSNNFFPNPTFKISQSLTQFDLYKYYSSKKDFESGEKLLNQLQVTDAEIQNLMKGFHGWKDREPISRHNHNKRNKVLQNQDNEDIELDNKHPKSMNFKGKEILKSSKSDTKTKKSNLKEDKIDKDTKELEDMEKNKDFLENFVNLSKANFVDTRVNEEKDSDLDANLQEIPDNQELELYISKNEKSELTLSRFNHAIYANALAGDVENAEKAFELMELALIIPNLRSHDHLLFAYSKAGNLEKAVSVFKKIESNGFVPSLYSYNGLINAYVKSSRLDDAYKVYELMKSRKVMPNETIYNQLLMGCLACGDTNRAWGTFEHMRYEISNISAKAMTIMINACTLNDEVEKALVLLDEMILKNQTLSDVTFNSLINACAHRPGYLNQAMELLVKMEKTGFKPDFYTYNTLLYACARNKNLEMARLFFKELMNKTNEFLKLDESSFTNLFWVYASHIKQVTIRPRKKALEYLSSRNPISLKFGENDDPTCTENNIEKNSELSDPIDSEQNQIFLSSSLDNPTNTEIEPYSSNLPVSLPLFLHSCPKNHKTTLVEAERVYKYFIECTDDNTLALQPNNGRASTRLLNSYLAVLVNHGAYYKAWRFYCEEYEKMGCKRDGWTIESILTCCDIQRDVEKAWIVWGHFKQWRQSVEKLIQPKLIGSKESSKDINKDHEISSTIDTQSDAKIIKEDQDTEHSPESNTDDMYAVNVNEWFEHPNIVAGGAAAVTPRDRESARRLIGCGKDQEYKIYQTMINMLAKNDQINSALRLLQELKTGIVDHNYSELKTRDFSTLFSRATQLEDERAVARMLALCRPTKQTLEDERRKKRLNKKWGTKRTFEIGIKRRLKSRNKYPEEFKAETKQN
ncbi:hypothetical protein BB558_002183 [Smittium angustum]|uniref:PROP1-like PPR domain-containing protein n=2 Tax=Smittium angustum TaxID=133377 RepID=A0A2U1J9I7_SMIAN|nr:hypothetical protein BB558_002183 [Smittium angustum]